jgi:hypothetical protein
MDRELASSSWTAVLTAEAKLDPQIKVGDMFVLSL